MDIAIFGTSADPPTIAHEKILTYLAPLYDLVAVYAADNPFKNHANHLDHRGNMLQLVIGNLTCSNILYTPELGDRRTIYTVEKVKQRWGENHNLTVVIGGDLIPQIFQWYRAQELWQSVKVLIIPRQGYTLDPVHINYLQQQSLGCAIASCETPALSSTDYRRYQDDNILSEEIKKYIEKHRLYH